MTSAQFGENQPFRFAVASDLHFGQPGTSYVEDADALVSSMNEEKRSRGLDAVFLNGDLVHDSVKAYAELKENYLERLETPYYAIKGNHDFVDGRKGSPGESWETIWGYPSNHVLELNGLVFILADTSAAMESHQFLPADADWLGKQLDSLKHKSTVFVFMHIAQRKHGVQGWPKFGVGHNQNQEAYTKAGEAVMTLLEAHKNVKAVFHGHNHHSCDCYISGGKPYFFDSRVGSSWGRSKGYRVVEVNTDDSITTYQYNMEEGVIISQHTI